MTMNDHAGSAPVNASRAVATGWGVLAGFGGLVHGIGEALQGNVATEGFFINSWAQGPIYEYMGGDPGITIIPNLLLTGILAILASLAVMIQAAFFVKRRRGGGILILLSIAMLLVGGGVGPPLVGIIAGWAGAGIHKPPARWRTIPAGIRNFLAALWPWLAAVSFLAALLLFVGALVLVYGFAMGNADFFLNLFFFVVVSELLTVISAFMYDMRRRKQPGNQ